MNPARVLPRFTLHPSWAAIALLLLFLLTTGMPAQEPGAVPNTNFVLKTLSNGVFEIGSVRLDQWRRAITLPAFVNLREGAIEYLLVHSNGKTHESVFRTDAEPYHIHVAMLLLGARTAGTNAFPEPPAAALPGEKVVVEIAWRRKSKQFRYRGETFVLDRKRKSVMTKGDWIYTGSRLREDGFAAQFDGSIISLITDPDALVNNPRPGREDDDNWLAKPGNLPAFNEPVEVIITFAEEGGHKGNSSGR